MSGIMASFVDAEPVTVRTRDGSYIEALELERKETKRGTLVKVSYLYISFTGWVRAERVRAGHDTTSHMKADG